jgi:hypothetical protein
VPATARAARATASGGASPRRALVLWSPRGQLNPDSGA